MTLSSLDLNGYGAFLDSPRAAFRIDRLNLPTPWDYIYQNRQVLLRVDQFGLDYAQAFPPTDVMLFRRDRYQQSSPWLTWLTSPQFEHGAFTSFFRPAPGQPDPHIEPDRVEVIFAPSHATYIIEHQGLRVTTRVLVATNEPSIIQAVQLTNLRAEALRLTAFPVLRHNVQWTSGDAWDKPEWYLRTAFHNDDSDRLGFSIYLMDPKCEADNRRGVAFWSNIDHATAAEVSYEKFVGAGSWTNPAAIFSGQLELELADGQPWGCYAGDNHFFAYPPVCALQYNYTLQPGESQTIHQVMAWIPLSDERRLPAVDVARRPARFLQERKLQAEIAQLTASFDNLASHRAIDTPDATLNHYVNDWLPLQLDWVCSLDRGHPSGMRGGRDSANDFTAMAALNPAWTRELILTELSCQRPDGWVPRHYSARGHTGKERDTRQHIDAGAWVIEMLYEYLAYSKDFAILQEQIPWLDQPADQTDSVLEHLLRAMDFFIAPDNIGEHGLIKLREGEWLDTVNKAGLAGRGEGVMITNQVIMCLVWMTQLLEGLVARGQFPAADFQQRQQRYAEQAASLKAALRQHAFNSEGYFSGFFNDDGQWLFSPQDPDGQRRVYGGANWWSIISGAAVPDLVDSCLKELDFLKTDMGYNLNHPPFDRQPVARVGRMASGDSPPGRSEHGNAYNQGSHGFLGRALAVAGRGDQLYEALKLLLPYDQIMHPVTQTLSAPYGVVNVWENIPRYRNRGKNTFLTGSIAYGLRMAYDWMLGIRPAIEGLVLDPCIPAHFEQAQATFTYLGQRCTLRIDNPSGRQAGVRELTLNGVRMTSTRTDPFSQRQVFVIPDDSFIIGENLIHVTL